MEAPGTKLTENFAAKGKRDWLPKNVSHILEPSWRNTRNISDSFVRSFVHSPASQHRNVRCFRVCHSRTNGKSGLVPFLHIRKDFACSENNRWLPTSTCTRMREIYACINTKRLANNTVLFIQ